MSRFKYDAYYYSMKRGISLFPRAHAINEDPEIIPNANAARHARRGAAGTWPWQAAVLCGGVKK